MNSVTPREATTKRAKALRSIELLSSREGGAFPAPTLRSVISDEACGQPDLSHTRVAHRHRRLIQAAPAIAVERTPERILGLSCCEREQGHGRAELQVI